MKNLRISAFVLIILLMLPSIIGTAPLVMLAGAIIPVGFLWSAFSMREQRMSSSTVYARHIFNPIGMFELASLTTGWVAIMQLGAIHQSAYVLGVEMESVTSFLAGNPAPLLITWYMLLLDFFPQILMAGVTMLGVTVIRAVYFLPLLRRSHA